MASTASPDDERVRQARREGVRAGSVVTASYIPFGIAAGAAMGATGVDPLVSIASSPIMYAGAAQIAAVQLLDIGAALALVVSAVAIINSRHLLYSAALAPYLAQWRFGHRMAAAFLLADPVFALAAARFARPDPETARARRAYYFGVGLVNLVGWTTLVAIGVVAGRYIPEWVPFELAIPLTFLLLMLPLIRDSAGLVAAAVGGIVALLANGLPLGVGLLIGAAAGILAGAAVQIRHDRGIEVEIDG